MSKVQIRQGLFETNSSSTHTITIADSEDFKNWKNDKVWYSEDNDDFLPVDKAIDANIAIIEEDFLNDGEKLPESFKKAYYETKSMEEAFEKIEEDFELEYDDLKWESVFYRSRKAWLELNSDYEDFDEEYTTKHGDKIVAFGYYGYC